MIETPEPIDEEMVQLPSGRLAVVVKVHDNGDCDYREGNGTVTRLANYTNMILIINDIRSNFNG